jgi:catalase (peroxidase I)
LRVEAAVASAFGLQAASYGVPCEPCAQGDAVGGLVRLAFHDATGGSGRVDGCIDAAEPANAGLEPIVSQLHAAWLPFADVVSFADTVVVAGQLALRAATTAAAGDSGGGSHVGRPEANGGSLRLPFRFGRPDAATPFACDDLGRLPGNTFSWAASQQFFAARFGLTVTETVALFGAHSVGRAEAANSGVEGGWTAFQSSFSTLYYKELVSPRWDKNTDEDWRDNQNHLQLTSDVELVVTPSAGWTKKPWNSQK